MESVLTFIGYWVGLNFGALAQASISGVVAGLIVAAIWRQHPVRARIAAAIAFLAVFGFRTAQITAGWVFLRSEDHTLATVAQLAVGVATLIGASLMILLRGRQRHALIGGFVIVLFIGASVPIAKELTQDQRAVATNVSAAPDAYPPVAIWASEVEGFGVMFPVEPTRVDAAGLKGSGYSYQSVFTFDEGGATANVTIAPVPFDLDSTSKRTFLLSAHRSFLQSIGAVPDSSRFKWDFLVSGVPVLQYEASFEYQGVPVISKGFWLFDRQRALRVSVAYPRALSAGSAAVADRFPNTFMLLSKRAPVGNAR